MNYKNFKRNKKRTNKGFRYKKFRKIKYHRSTKPATFGPGFYNLNVTKLYDGPLNVEYTTQLYTDILNNNPEFDRVINDFKYVKLNYITICFPPRNVTSSTQLTDLYFLINFDGEPTQNLRLQDSHKTVGAFHTRPKYYKFDMPRMNIQNNMIKAWFARKDLLILDDILLQFYSPDNPTNWKFSVNVNISLRGPTNNGENKVEMINVDVQTENKKFKEMGIQTTNEYNLFNNERKKYVNIIKELQEKLKIKNEEIKNELNIKKLVKKLDKEDEKEVKPKSLKSFQSDYYSVKSFNSNLTNQSLPSVKSEDYKKILDESNNISNAFEKYADRQLALQLLGEHYKSMFTVYDIISDIGKRIINENIEDYNKFKDIFKEECKKKSKFLKKKLKDEDVKKILFITNKDKNKYEN